MTNRHHKLIVALFTLLACARHPAWPLPQSRNASVRPTNSELVTQVITGDLVTRREAIKRLSDDKSPEAIAALIGVLDDADLRIEVQQALKRIGSLAVEPLVVALQHRNLNIRPEAAFTLGSIGDARAVQPLIRAHRNGDRGLRWRSAQALGFIANEAAATYLEAALRRRDLTTIAAAYDFFIRRGLPRSENTIIDALERHGRVVMAVDLWRCGNEELETAATKWLLKRGAMRDFPREMGPRWGQAAGR